VYNGWQSQNNAVAIQDIVKNAVSRLTGEEVKLIGASRTDAGVHAYGQTANFHTASAIPADKFSFALNALLPEDIVIRRSEEVSPDFHARFSAKGKRYRYLIFNSRHPSALMRHRAYHVFYPLNIEHMRNAAEKILGTHDFSAFRASGSDTKTSVRTMTHVSVERQDEVIAFEIAGDGFLYNMVRIITGTLVEIGAGRLPADCMDEIIQEGNRVKAGRTAPPQGLYLVEVLY
jgi:tRNA pseudouridine38-40 synthase